MSREEDFLSACIEFADTCGDDYDVVVSAQRLADRCVDLVETREAGIMLADREGTLCHIASSSEQIRLIELYELEQHAGPNLDVYRAGVAAHRSLGDGALTRWPRVASRARKAGFASVSVLPMRLRNDTIGTLGLFCPTPDPLDPCEQSAVQALADIATIGILQQRALNEERVAISQLETALHSRVIIEQAKGILSERLGVPIDTAFSLLRSYARSHNCPLRTAATNVVSKTLSVEEITCTTRTRDKEHAR